MESIAIAEVVASFFADGTLVVRVSRHLADQQALLPAQSSDKFHLDSDSVAALHSTLDHVQPPRSVREAFVDHGLRLGEYWSRSDGVCRRVLPAGSTWARTQNTAASNPQM